MKTERIESGTLDINKLLEETTIIFPIHSLKTGDSWSFKKEFELVNIGRLELKTIAKLVGFEKVRGVETAKIESNFEGIMNGEKKYHNVVFVLKGKEKGKGITNFDLKRKKIIKHQNRIDGNFEVGPKSKDSVPPGAKELKTKYVTHSTLELMRK